MQNAISTLRIRNFKSIKDVTINPRRVNLIIGEPNVGKSNVLEAMSLLGGMVYEMRQKFMRSFIRYDRIKQIFYDDQEKNLVSVETDTQRCYVGYDDRNGRFKSIFTSTSGWKKVGEHWQLGPLFHTSDALTRAAFDIFNGDDYRLSQAAGYLGYSSIESDGTCVGCNESGFTQSTDSIEKSVRLRPYVFRKEARQGAEYAASFLRPPNGFNLKQVIQAHSDLRKSIAKLFDHYGQKVLLTADDQDLAVTKEVDGITYSVPYANTADTLQRLIFYLAAIESNDDAVILFEEPEAHSYPVYVSKLGRRIAESRNNQFFVATHSPYLITEILETMLPDEEQAQEVAIFVAYYEDYQTKLRQLTDAEVRGIRNDGLDVFYNMDRLVHPEA